MIFDAHENYKQSLVGYVKYLVPNIKNEAQQNTDFARRLSKGEIKYDNNYFIGKLPISDYNYLVSHGAKQTKRGLFIPTDKLPQKYKTVIVANENKRKTIINQYKDKIATLANSDNSLFIAGLADEIFKRLNKQFKKEDLSFNFTKNQLASLFGTKLQLDGDFIDFLLKKINNITISGAVETEQKIKDICFYNIRNSIFNRANEALFSIQQETAIDNGIQGFYWWHRPTLRPSDRMFHRKHFNDSKKGKKFYFNNLPMFNGQPDYPGKLWNCHCRAYIRKTEFDRASE